MERASFARIAIESHYELLLKSVQVLLPPENLFRAQFETHLQSDQERKTALLKELAEQGASEAQVHPPHTFVSHRYLSDITAHRA